MEGDCTLWISSGLLTSYQELQELRVMSIRRLGLQGAQVPCWLSCSSPPKPNTLLSASHPLRSLVRNAYLGCHSYALCLWDVSLGNWIAFSGLQRLWVMKQNWCGGGGNVIDTFKVTHFPVVPPILAALTQAKAAGGCELKSLIQVSSGAAPLSRKIIHEFLDAFPHVDLIQGYGMTESTAVGTRGFNSKSLKKYTSVGLLAPNMQAKVISCKTGSCLPPGSSGYLHDETATRSAIDEDGWLRTGDIAYFDHDGYLHVVDRLKDAIKYKGFQIAPADLEAVLISHPEVLDVAVTSAEDEEAGEIPVAFIVRAPGSAISSSEIIEYTAKRVTPYKKVRKVVFVQSIPRTPAGKILKRVLKNHNGVVKTSSAPISHRGRPQESPKSPHSILALKEMSSTLSIMSAAGLLAAPSGSGMSGVNKLADLVGVTLGPKGKKCCLGEQVELEDPVENIGAKLVRQAASKTNDLAGDGTTTSVVLAQGLIAEGVKVPTLCRLPGALKELPRLWLAGAQVNVKRGQLGWRTVNLPMWLQSVLETTYEIGNMIAEGYELLIKEYEKEKLNEEDSKTLWWCCSYTAVEEGIVVGGGCTLLRLASKVDAIKDTLENDEQKVGADIVKRALSYPLKLIAKNAGVNGAWLLREVVRCCLEHAASVAKTFLTSDVRGG
ncbi:hypothetical protein J5N97_024935 [Dioscorea zingiberensis]|uniref:4-coumarate--CoA ligase n=1 Tax=Dioscorea zingiberensis TaxID=325984 RepID=A0A9D5C815_9LILI|nr:hypothetical protein J5N97_024935 [Dioscorea zingiberensis]